MLNPHLLVICGALVILFFLIVQIFQYRLSLSIENRRRGFFKSEFFLAWIKEVLITIWGCIIALEFSVAYDNATSIDDTIKSLSSAQINISSEYKNNEAFKGAKGAVKNGEDVFIANLLNEDISDETRRYLNNAGYEIRCNYNLLQDEQNITYMSKYVERINSEYDNIIRLLELEIEYQRGNITEFAIREQYEAYINSKGPDDPEVLSTDSGYRILLRVRLDGDEDKSWKASVNAQVGDIVEFLAEYKNVSDDTHTNVMIKNVPPKNLEIISGTTKLFNSNHPNGGILNADAIETQPFNIGHYNPNSNAYISFKAKVINVSLQPGSNTLVNWTQCGVGDVTIQDYACVVLNYEGEIS